jgi:hypothetical protein
VFVLFLVSLFVSVGAICYIILSLGSLPFFLFYKQNEKKTISQIQSPKSLFSRYPETQFVIRSIVFLSDSSCTKEKNNQRDYEAHCRCYLGKIFHLLLLSSVFFYLFFSCSKTVLTFVFEFLVELRELLECIQ